MVNKKRPVSLESVLSRQETPNSVCEVYKQKVHRSRRIGSRGDGGDKGGSVSVCG